MMCSPTRSLIEMARDHNGRQIELIHDTSIKNWPYMVNIYDIATDILVSTMSYSTIGYAQDAFKAELD